MCWKYLIEKRKESKTTDRSGENSIEINFMLVGGNDKKYLKDVKAIYGYLQHLLVLVVIKEENKKVMRQK